MPFIVNVHQTRVAIREAVTATLACHDFDERGICTDNGKFENQYEATVYFHNVGLEGDFGEGLISHEDGSSECAYKVDPIERAMLAGPWDVEGHISSHDDFLFVVVECSDGGVISSHSTASAWAERMAEHEAEYADD